MYGIETRTTGKEDQRRIEENVGECSRQAGRIELRMKEKMIEKVSK